QVARALRPNAGNGPEARNWRPCRRRAHEMIRVFNVRKFARGGLCRQAFALRVEGMAFAAVSIGEVQPHPVEGFGRADATCCGDMAATIHSQAFTQTADADAGRNRLPGMALGRVAMAGPQEFTLRLRPGLIQNLAFRQDIGGILPNRCEFFKFHITARRVQHEGNQHAEGHGVTPGAGAEYTVNHFAAPRLECPQPGQSVTAGGAYDGHFSFSSNVVGVSRTVMAVLLPISVKLRAVSKAVWFTCSAV